MNIVLIGYRAVGKSTLGRLLAHELGMKFLDTDTLLGNKIGEDIESYVKKNGWQAFRKLECEVLQSLIGIDRHVIATGGGVVDVIQNLEILKSLGHVIWLKAPINRILERLKQNPRPPLLCGVPEKEVKLMLPKRIPLYMKAADLVLDTGDLDLKEASKLLRLLIQDLISGGACAR